MATRLLDIIQVCAGYVHRWVRYVCSVDVQVPVGHEKLTWAISLELHTHPVSSSK